MMYRMALPLLAFLASSGCASNVATPRSGALNLRKDCSTHAGRAGDICTVTSSNLAEIAVGSRIVYASAAVGTNLDTDIVIHPPGSGNDAVAGHCTVSLATGIGTCTLSGGTGKFSSLRASVAVSNVTETTSAWDGTYTYGQ